MVQVLEQDISDSKVIGGRVEPYRTIYISSKINGIVDSLNARVGRKVKTGEILLEFDKSELASKRNQTAAALDIAKANYNKVKRGVDEADIRKGKANYDQAEAVYKGAKSNLELLITI